MPTFPDNIDGLTPPKIHRPPAVAGGENVAGSLLKQSVDLANRLPNPMSLPSQALVGNVWPDRASLISTLGGGQQAPGRLNPLADPNSLAYALSMSKEFPGIIPERDVGPLDVSALMAAGTKPLSMAERGMRPAPEALEKFAKETRFSVSDAAIFTALGDRVGFEWERNRVADEIESWTSINNVAKRAQAARDSGNFEEAGRISREFLDDPLTRNRYELLHGTEEGDRIMREFAEHGSSEIGRSPAVTKMRLLAHMSGTPEGEAISDLYEQADKLRLDGEYDAAREKEREASQRFMVSNATAKVYSDAFPMAIQLASAGTLVENQKIDVRNALRQEWREARAGGDTYRESEIFEKHPDLFTYDQEDLKAGVTNITGISDDEDPVDALDPQTIGKYLRQSLANNLHAKTLANATVMPDHQKLRFDLDSFKHLKQMEQFNALHPYHGTIQRNVALAGTMGLQTAAQTSRLELIMAESGILRGAIQDKIGVQETALKIRDSILRGNVAQAQTELMRMELLRDLISSGDYQKMGKHSKTYIKGVGDIITTYSEKLGHLTGFDLEEMKGFRGALVGAGLVSPSLEYAMELQKKVGSPFSTTHMLEVLAGVEGTQHHLNLIKASAVKNQLLRNEFEQAGYDKKKINQAHVMFDAIFPLMNDINLLNAQGAKAAALIKKWPGRERIYEKWQELPVGMLVNHLQHPALAQQFVDDDLKADESYVDEFYDVFLEMDGGPYAGIRQTDGTLDEKKIKDLIRSNLELYGRASRRAMTSMSGLGMLSSGGQVSAASLLQLHGGGGYQGGGGFPGLGLPRGGSMPGAPWSAYPGGGIGGGISPMEGVVAAFLAQTLNVEFPQNSRGVDGTLAGMAGILGPNVNVVATADGKGIRLDYSTMTPRTAKEIQLALAAHREGQASGDDDSVVRDKPETAVNNNSRASGSILDPGTGNTPDLRGVPVPPVNRPGSDHKRFDPSDAFPIVR